MERNLKNGRNIFRVSLLRQFDGRMALEERRGSVPGVVRNSPDLIIENLWSQMKHLQYTKRATSIEEIMKMAQNFAMPSLLVPQKLYKSLIWHMQAVIDVQGAHIKYVMIHDQMKTMAFVNQWTSVNERKIFPPR